MGIVAVMSSAVHGPFWGSLFCFADGCPLTHQMLSSTVQSLLHSAGYLGSYSGHNFLIDAASTAAYRALPDHLVIAGLVTPINIISIHQLALLVRFPVY